jgi:hypothetical protein
VLKVRLDLSVVVETKDRQADKGVKVDKDHKVPKDLQVI